MPILRSATVPSHLEDKGKRGKGKKGKGTVVVHSVKMFVKQIKKARKNKEKLTTTCPCDKPSTAYHILYDLDRKLADPRARLIFWGVFEASDSSHEGASMLALGVQRRTPTTLVNLQKARSTNVCLPHTLPRDLLVNKCCRRRTLNDRQTS